MIRYYHSVGRVPLAIRFAYGFPRLYQFVYPIPVRSVSVRGRLFVSFGLFVFSRATGFGGRTDSHRPNIVIEIGIPMQTSGM